MASQKAVHDFDHKCMKICSEKWLDEEGALLNLTDVATAPSKDFYQVYITEDEITLRVWKIVPPTRQEIGSSPLEIRDKVSEFKYDDRMHSEIQRIGGERLLNYVAEVCEGHVDYLPRLHSLQHKILEKIILSLDLEDISTMSRVNKMFRELCNGDALWYKIYALHSETPITEELHMLAAKSGWKRLFFTNKLQLQVQLRRMKNLPPPGQYAFLTSQEEDMDTAQQRQEGM